MSSVSHRGDCCAAVDAAAGGGGFSSRCSMALYGSLAVSQRVYTMTDPTNSVSGSGQQYFVLDAASHSPLFTIDFGNVYVGKHAIVITDGNVVTAGVIKFEGLRCVAEPSPSAVESIVMSSSSLDRGASKCMTQIYAASDAVGRIVCCYCIECETLAACLRFRAEVFARWGSCIARQMADNNIKGGRSHHLIGASSTGSPMTTSGTSSSRLPRSVRVYRPTADDVVSSRRFESSSRGAMLGGAQQPSSPFGSFGDHSPSNHSSVFVNNSDARSGAVVQSVRTLSNAVVETREVHHRDVDVQTEEDDGPYSSPRVNVASLDRQRFPSSFSSSLGEAGSSGGGPLVLSGRAIFCRCVHCGAIVELSERRHHNENCQPRQKLSP